MLTIIGYILLGFLKLLGFFAAFLVAIAAIAWGTEYVITPIAKRTPRWVLTVWYYVWRAVMIGVGAMVFLVALYSIGAGEP